MKKILSIVLALMLLCSMAFAETNVLRVGTNPEFNPFEYIDDGVLYGIDVAIMEALAAEMGYTVEWEYMDFSGLCAAVATGKIDASIAGMTITEERKDEVNFSTPYFNATQAIAVPAENAIVAGEADLDGKKLGVVLNYTGDLYATDNCPNATIERYNTGIEAMLDLKNGRLDAVILDIAPATTIAEDMGGLVILEDRLSEEEYGIAVNKANTELLEKINAALAVIIENGVFQQCIDMYTGAAAAADAE